MKVLALKLDVNGNLVNVANNDIVLSRDSLFGDGVWKTIDNYLCCTSNSAVSKSNIPFNVASFYEYDKIEVYFSLYLPSNMEYSKKYCFISVDIDPEERNSSFLLYKPANTSYLALYHQGERVWTQNSFGYIKGVISVEKISNTEVSEYVKLIDNDNNTLYESTHTTSTFDGNFYFTTGTDSYFTGTYYYQSGTIYYPDVSDLLTSPKVAYYQLLDNPSNNLKGNWEITEDGYLSVTGMTNGSIAMFSKLGALKDFTLEWTSTQLGGSYIHSNLCPILRYTPEDLGIEGGGNNVAMQLYLCNYTGTDTAGTILLVDESGRITKAIPEIECNLSLNSTHTFKLVRSGSNLSFYEDGTLISTTTNLSSKPLYFGWYLWYDGSNSAYQTNFILQDYKLEGEIFVNTKNYLDKEGLRQVWQRIKDYHEASLSNYYTKEEVDALISSILGANASTTSVEDPDDLNDIVNEEINENPRSEVNSN